MWQIPHFAMKPGSEFYIMLVFAVLLLTECIFWCVLPGFWKPRLFPWLSLGSHSSVVPDNVWARQPLPQRTSGFLTANVLQLHQSFAITCMIQHRCKTCVSKKKRQEKFSPLVLDFLPSQPGTCGCDHVVQVLPAL